MEIYFNSCCIITGDAVFINEHAAAMLRMQESELMSEWPVNMQVCLVLLLASCTQLITCYKTYRKSPTVVCFILTFHSLCWIKESRDGWCGRGMVYCRMTDCNDSTVSLWTPPSAWTAPELQGTVSKKWLQTRTAFERKRSIVKSTIYIPRIDMVI